MYMYVCMDYMYIYIHIFLTCHIILYDIIIPARTDAGPPSVGVARCGTFAHVPSRSELSNDLLKAFCPSKVKLILFLFNFQSNFLFFIEDQIRSV